MLHSFTGSCLCVCEGNSEGASLGDLFRACEQGGVCPLGRGSEGKGQSEFRQSFLRRADDPQLNERLHHLRILTSTLKVGLGSAEPPSFANTHPFMTKCIKMSVPARDFLLQSQLPGQQLKAVNHFCWPKIAGNPSGYFN